MLFLLLFLLKHPFFAAWTGAHSFRFHARNRSSPASVVDHLEQVSVASRLKASDIFRVMNDFLNHFFTSSGHVFVLCKDSVNFVND